MSDSEPVVVGFPTTPSSTDPSPSLVDGAGNCVGDVDDCVGDVALGSLNVDPPCIVGMGMVLLFQQVI
jgi:hypothetical protein